ncbi:hypothetical protein JL107_00870 [Nakamurella flavida]|uniref:Uncharacterized protein n=1 Tax=Nakamurella flavida TaxID=363630 RepID=A0A938YL92_9ACTN|nr:hypothetical protein [Nakamurella flavida]MBM9474985.1 hypothetical protein [Nakamurella flavida]MDP9776554.1 ammonia channel protein AmtB [Nakamurella flavida]
MRILDTVAGVLAAGLLLLGLLLLALQLLAPSVLAAWGVQDAAGPTWGRVVAHVAVGVAGEVVVGLRARWSTSARAGADATVIVLSLAVLWWGWWS